MLRKTLFFSVLSALTLAAGAQTVPAIDVDVKDRAQVLSYLQDPEGKIIEDSAVIAFYQKVDSWDRMRDLRHHQLPGNIWNHLADARTNLVKRLYADVHVEMYNKHGVYLNDPKKENHFIGTPPSHPNFKGVFSDLDVGMFLDPEKDPKKMAAGLTRPERQEFQIEAKRSMEAKLAAYGPDSGYLFDTNLYTTPEMFDESDVGSKGLRELERYDDVLAYLAIRIGCGPDEVRWLDLKQRLLTRAREKEGVEPRVRQLVEEAEKKYEEFERLKRDAIAEAKRKGREVYLGLDEQAVTRYFEDQILAFIKKHGNALSAKSDTGQALRTEYNKLKADYEASLRESYFTFAAQTYIVRWELKSAAEKQAFLSDPNKIRRVRADQARFILHYLHDPPGNVGEDLRFKLQKIAKYEQRELNVLSESDGKLLTMAGFGEGEILDMFTEMKGKTTPEEAWVVWRTRNYNRLLKRDLKSELQRGEMKKAEEYATIRAKAYLEHIEVKLIDIATDLPVFGS